MTHQQTRNRLQPGWGALWGLVALAALLLGLTFGLSWGNFWLKINTSVIILAALSLVLRPLAPGELRPRTPDLAWGLGSAAVLWLLFWLGKAVSIHIFPFAGAQIGAIYHQGQGVPLPLTVLSIFFLTGPCEELFWRRFVQQSLMERLGPGRGWLGATALYAGAHLPSMNFMLIAAAAVAGAFWGFLYWKLGRIPPVIISHAVWSSVIFALLPIP
jgi:membrane protease YdiL (CAAX protease family)